MTKEALGYTLTSVLRIKDLMIGVARIVMIIGQAVAGVSVGMVELAIFTGISLAANAFSALLFRNIAD